MAHLTDKPPTVISRWALWKGRSICTARHVGAAPAQCWADSEDIGPALSQRCAVEPASGLSYLARDNAVDPEMCIGLGFIVGGGVYGPGRKLGENMIQKAFSIIYCQFQSYILSWTHQGELV